ncbi:ATP-binding protein [Bifidobacterium sp. SMB2]|uniref:ATP-binding protein n=1 Tax=Bifidobacterium saimiriisciurei TaxID=2661627 RepID=A0ABX0CC34_9BIFI|nr:MULTISPECIES: ATP-binding protein [Bifidobacterium]NEG97089.1 ATP-binding protein [Bifidobacterium sp. SMB2]NEH12135.1 ATP-binding protein [Bifidobacterium saimiriisciurei]
MDDGNLRSHDADDSARRRDTGGPGPASSYDSPLRRTTLSSLVDAASRMQESQRNVRPATVGIITALVGVLSVGLAVLGVVAGLPVRVVVGLALVFIGVTVGWTQMSFVMDDRLHPETHTSRLTIVVMVAGMAAAIIGVLVMFSTVIRLIPLFQGAVAGLVMIAALGVIVAPWWISLVSDLGMQRARTAREELRADIASRLHDSVLQTLALIQMQSGDSAKVAALARAQERDLREWLYGDPEAVASSVGVGHSRSRGNGNDGGETAVSVSTDALRRMRPPSGAPIAGIPVPGPSSSPEPFSRVVKRVAAGVEDAQEKPIDVVVVGECTYTPELESLLYAASEAMTNAAKHGAAPISVYMEVGGGRVQLFVRDHGEGFDVGHLPAGHLGVKESILGRMKRAGGTAEIVSRPGWGTEVRLSQPMKG